MQDYKRVAILENQIEAGLLESILLERGIPHLLRSYHDTAYDGLFQNQRGWGELSAPQGHIEEIMEILLDLRVQADADDPS
jgi:hypothetical protein